jgi:hypothetical protein
VLAWTHDSDHLRGKSSRPFRENPRQGRPPVEILTAELSPRAVAERPVVRALDESVIAVGAADREGAEVSGGASPLRIPDSLAPWPSPTTRRTVSAQGCDFGRRPLNREILWSRRRADVIAATGSTKMRSDARMRAEATGVQAERRIRLRGTPRPAMCLLPPLPLDQIARLAAEDSDRVTHHHGNPPPLEQRSTGSTDSAER